MYLWQNVQNRFKLVVPQTTGHYTAKTHSIGVFPSQTVMNFLFSKLHNKSWTNLIHRFSFLSFPRTR